MACPARDNCMICLGARGGEPGNENIINGVAVCDYCHVTWLDAVDAGLDRFLPPNSELLGVDPHNP